MNQSPTIYVPTKRTDEVDWSNPLKRYIQTTYQEDPEKYAEEANTIHRLRQDMRGAGKDLTGRDVMYRYYGQLELLELRFPVDENHIRVSFTWYDAFTHKATSQFSLAYEKACTIFNIASILSAIAACQNRSETDGVKRAFNFFQASAGMYNYINDNFLHAPSTDLSREAVKLLSQLMLTQAQETFLEQSLSGKKKPAFIAKLASQTGWSYGNIVENMNDLVTKSIFDKSWLTMCQIKHKYHMSIAQYQKALACEGEGKYGECVGRLNVAETLAKDANKSSNSFVSAFSSTASPTLPPDAANSLQDLTKSNLALITDKKTSATRDNDIVYHESVPQESVIPPIEKLIAVKPIPIQELYNNPNDIQKVIGADIFQRLIPLSVHESASLYSEEKAKIVRGETERCDLANAELEAVLDYMKLPGSLSKFKNINDARSFNEFLTPTSEVKQWANLIKEEEEQKGSFKDLSISLQGLKGQSKDLMDDITLVIESEQRDFDTMRSKYGDSWTQLPSTSFTTVFRQDLLSHRDRFEQAGNSDRHLFQRYEQAMPDIVVLSNGENNDELERVFAEVLVSFSKTSSDGENLLDVDIPQSFEDIPAKVNKVEECLSNLYKVKKERMDTLNDLKEKTHQDDISHLLILNKKTTNIEPQLFATELEKFSPYRSRITSSIHHQQVLLQELTTFYKNLVEGEEAQSLQERWDQAERKRKEVCERFKKAKDSYLEVKDGLRKGIQFYVDLNDLIENLSKTVHQFAKTRHQEREDLIQSIQNQEQLRIKSQLSKFNAANATTPNIGSTPFDTSAHLSEELNKLSLNNVPSHVNPSAPSNFSPSAPSNFSPSAPSNFSPSAPSNFSPSAPSNFSPSAPSNFSPSAPSNFSPSAPSNFSPSAPSNFSPSAPPHVNPSAQSNVNTPAPSHVSPSAPLQVSPSAALQVSPSAPLQISPSAPLQVNPSAPSHTTPSAPPPPMSGPNSPTSHNPYYSQTSQRIATQLSLGYSTQPASPKAHGPPVPPLPTEYQQSSVHFPFQSDTQRSYQSTIQPVNSQPQQQPQQPPPNTTSQPMPKQYNVQYQLPQQTNLPQQQQQPQNSQMHNQPVTPQQQSFSRPSSIYAAPLPSQPNYSPANYRYSQQQPPQQSSQLPAQHRQSSYDNFSSPLQSPLQSGYIQQPSNLHQSQVSHSRPIQQQYPAPPSVVQPQQYNMQGPQFNQPPQMLPTQQPQNFYQTNQIPPQVQQPVGYYQQFAPPVSVQQGNYPPTASPQQSNNGYQQAPYNAQYRPPTAPPPRNDGPSLLD